jgi:Carbohydrate esterase, sialic acid-specific acetylesterase
MKTNSPHSAPIGSSALRPSLALEKAGPNPTRFVSRAAFRAHWLQPLVFAFAAACGVTDHPHPEDVQPQPLSTVKPMLGGGGSSSASASQPAPIVTPTASAPASAAPAVSTQSPTPMTSATVPNTPSAGMPSVNPPVASASATATAVEPATPPAPTEVVPEATLDLNGTTVLAKDVLAFIHIGHSNMAGRASGPSSERDYYFNDVDPATWVYRKQAWSPALEPNTAGDSGNRIGGLTLGGPGTTLVKQAAALAKDKYIVSLGYGVGSAYCTQFLPGALYYDQLIPAAKELKGHVTFAAIVIMLGITERHGTDQDIQGYPECINQLATAIRNDVGDPNLPLLITDYEMESTGEELDPNGAFGTKIRPIIATIPSVVSNSALVPTDGLSMQDDHHFDLAGYKEWCKRALQIMQDKGWFPWAK